jgi:hypothetical protein
MFAPKNGKNCPCAYFGQKSNTLGPKVRYATNLDWISGVGIKHVSVRPKMR